MKKTLLAFLMLWCILQLNAHSLIPSPEQLTMTEECFELGKSPIRIYMQNEKIIPLSLLQTEVLDNASIRITSRPNKADIRLRISADIQTEGYRLSITPKYIDIEATDKGGFVYALQTLRQLRVGDENRWQCVSVSDRPRMKWRGFMLDSGRQYQSVATIKKYIDMALMLKMNVFHWHLTEGLGWRIEIMKYPQFTQKGAFVGKGEEQQGFYSQEEIRELVNYAEERNITIVPEIDMPGHAEAALASYPELGCFGLPVEIPKTGFTKNIFCAGKEHTIRVLKEVLDEVCQLFPSPYIHLGGDEAPKGNWDECPDCQQRIKENSLRDTHDLQLWFSAEMANHLKNKGRKTMFWGDVVYKTGYTLPDNVIIQWWNYRSNKDLALRNALKHGYPVVCSSNYYNYLNFPVTPWRDYQENRTFNLRDAYTRNPSYQAVQEDNPLIWGMTCALWTDDGVTEALIDERLFPRILALAEQMWHYGKLAPFEVFHQRVKDKKAWFNSQGFMFGPAFKETDNEISH